MNLFVCIPVSRSPHTAVSVGLNAETGATVNAPVLAGNTFTAPVTIINSTAGHGTVTVTLLTETHGLLAVSETVFTLF